MIDIRFDSCGALEIKRPAIKHAEFIEQTCPFSKGYCGLHCPLLQIDEPNPMPRRLHLCHATHYVSSVTFYGESS